MKGLRALGARVVETLGRTTAITLALALLGLVIVPAAPAGASATSASPPAGASATAASDPWPGGPVDIADLRVRDPFVVVDRHAGWSYLVGTGSGFPMYRSSDLKTWYGPKYVFTPPPGFWGVARSWAPEIHQWNGRWYLFGSFASKSPLVAADGDIAGTAVLVSDAIDGPYVPLTNGPVTPTDRFALDGTLFVDPAGRPWMVYAQEWLDPRTDHMGRMAAVRLTDDLAATVGSPVELFAAKDAPWAPQAFVTDGPWLRRAADGSLLMLWSSFGTKYTIGIARSRSGAVTGPWEQLCLPFFDADGGHAMLFEDLQGVERAAFHAPNTGETRVLLPPVAEHRGSLVITDPALPVPSGAACPPAACPRADQHHDHHGAHRHVDHNVDRPRGWGRERGWDRHPGSARGGHASPGRWSARQ